MFQYTGVILQFDNEPVWNLIAELPKRAGQAALETWQDICWSEFINGVDKWPNVWLQQVAQWPPSVSPMSTLVFVEHLFRTLNSKLIFVHLKYHLMQLTMPLICSDAFVYY